MRIRLRAPNGGSTISLPEDASIADLLSQITSQTSLSSFDIKYGYPPKPLLLSAHPGTTPLSSLETKLNGEQLTISASESAIPPEVAQKTTPSVSFAASPGKSKRPIALKKKDMSGKEVPEIPMPERHATLGIPPPPPSSNTANERTQSSE